MAKVAVLTSVHSIVDVRIVDRQCRSLSEAGHEVTLVIPDEGTLCPEGIRVVRIPLPAGRKDRLLRTVPRVFDLVIPSERRP